jgi:hypothetical protein
LKAPGIIEIWFGSHKILAFLKQLKHTSYALPDYDLWFLIIVFRGARHDSIGGCKIKYEISVSHGSLLPLEEPHLTFLLLQGLNTRHFEWGLAS